MTAVDVDALDAARAAATAGEWENPHPFTKLINAPGSTDNLAIVRCYNEADAALIVAAVNSLPDLLAEIREGRALREAVEGDAMADVVLALADDFLAAFPPADGRMDDGVDVDDAYDWWVAQAAALRKKDAS